MNNYVFFEFILIPKKYIYIHYIIYIYIYTRQICIHIHSFRMAQNSLFPLLHIIYLDLRSLWSMQYVWYWPLIHYPLSHGGMIIQAFGCWSCICVCSPWEPWARTMDSPYSSTNQRERTSIIPSRDCTQVVSMLGINLICTDLHYRSACTSKKNIHQFWPCGDKVTKAILMQISNNRMNSCTGHDKHPPFRYMFCANLCHLTTAKWILEPPSMAISDRQNYCKT